MNWAYMAGFFDGDGGVSISKQLQVYFTQSNHTILQFWRDELNMGSIHPMSGTAMSTKTCWAWRLWDKQAAHVLLEMLPYLVIKADQAQIALQWFNTRQNNPRRQGVSPEVLALRQQLADKLRDIKHSTTN